VCLSGEDELNFELAKTLIVEPKLRFSAQIRDNWKFARDQLIATAARAAFEKFT